jgi:hypothetical protein
LALTVSVTGSLLTSLPISTVTPGWPPNVTDRGDVTAAPLARIATDARPNRTARSPNVLASRIRTAVPPACVCTIMRTVWFVNVGTVVSAADECGEAPQASTHVEAADAAGPRATIAPATTRTRTGSSATRFAIVYI